MSKDALVILRNEGLYTSKSSLETTELRFGFIHLFCDKCKIHRAWEDNLTKWLDSHEGHTIELLTRK